MPPAPKLRHAPPKTQADRAYLERVITLIQGARESVDMSMFTLQSQPDPKDPANRLIQALAAAAQSGKQVEERFLRREIPLSWKYRDFSSLQSSK